MESLNFIKKYHKKYLNINKINNNIYDEKGYNYEYYYNKYCIKEIILKYNYSPTHKFILYIFQKIPNIILPLYFDKYNAIYMINNNIIIDYHFKNINFINCNNLIINNKMNKLDTIENINTTIINNKTNLKQIYICNNTILILNYPINNILKINYHKGLSNNNYNNYNNYNNNISLTIINNTNKKLYICGNYCNIKDYYFILNYTKKDPLILESYSKNIITKNILISKSLK